MIETITNTENNIQSNQTDSFTSLFSKNINNNLQFYQAEESDIPIDDESCFDFKNFLNNLSNTEETVDLRQLMINELRRQGISDPNAYLGKGGIDIALRLGVKYKHF